MSLHSKGFGLTHCAESRHDLWNLRATDQYIKSVLGGLIATLNPADCTPKGTHVYFATGTLHLDFSTWQQPTLCHIMLADSRKDISKRNSTKLESKQSYKDHPETAAEGRSAGSLPRQ